MWRGKLPLGQTRRNGGYPKWQYMGCASPNPAQGKRRAPLFLLTKGDNRLLADPGVDGTGPVGVVKRIQRGEKSIDLDTRQAKYGGRVVAWLSGRQAELVAL